MDISWDSRINLKTVFVTITSRLDIHGIGFLFRLQPSPPEPWSNTDDRPSGPERTNEAARGTNSFERSEGRPNELTSPQEAF